ncbi:carboxylesterase family protein [Umezawaea sp. Da 62-37]|uniref:carboxylesterase/lipase family protein n=1 Tax=Umezawaea sp. Da 62-37 TaxID=3075927 RepID=UPI0028F6C784|nr:carboxylesterase family protein [Umezawaea sp. Da 62-37]WNV85975.1 carboxylesterase family protein [Umezawaea sp. Da 62-37]
MDTEVLTTSGPVRGLGTGHGAVFHGVPYAAAPVGALRFAAPRPHEPWTEVRDATRPGPTAPQPVRGGFGSLDVSPYFAPGWVEGADHLVLDIHVPARADRLAPVVVFVHGGGFTAGSAGSPMYDGTAFARDGVVLVTVEYRLGVPGFLHLPDAPDNRGLLDVLAALHWLRDNASRFGGDPDNVTLSGQSAGAIIVGGVLADPASKGLVRRAIMQSGSGTAAFTAEQAGIVTAAVGRELGIEPTAEALADVPDRTFVDLMPRLNGLDLGTPTHHDPFGGITPFSLVLDRQPADALAEGRGSGVDLLIGSNVDEGALYLAPLGGLSASTDDDVLAVAARFHPRPAELVAAYRAERPDATPAGLRVAVLGDGMFGAGTRRVVAARSAADTPTFVYEFTWRSDALDGELGACHVVELPFVFDHADLPSLHGPNALLGTTAPPADLARRMHRAWVDFATTGDPGWPRHEPEHRLVRRIGATWETVGDPRPGEARAWS